MFRNIRNQNDKFNDRSNLVSFKKRVKLDSSSENDNEIYFHLPNCIDQSIINATIFFLDHFESIEMTTKINSICGARACADLRLSAHKAHTQFNVQLRRGQYQTELF